MSEKKRPENNGNKKKDDNKFYMVIIPIIVFIVVAGFILFSYFENKSKDTMEYNKLIEAIQNKEVEKIEMEVRKYQLKSNNEGR